MRKKIKSTVNKPPHLKKYDAYQRAKLENITRNTGIKVEQESKKH